MKRSSAVQISLLASVAALTLSCGSDRPPRRCVNAQNQVVDESFCRGDYRGGGGVLFIPYHYYYGGPRGFVPMGSMLSGGSTAAPRGGYSAAPTASGTSSGASSGTSRGGVGSAGEAAHGGGGE